MLLIGDSVLGPQTDSGENARSSSIATASLTTAMGTSRR